MATNARLGFGTTLTFSTFSGEITSLSITADREQLDVTHMQSPDEFREFIGGLKDPGELVVEVNFEPATPTPLGLAKAPLSITFPDGTVWDWPDAEATGYDNEVPVGEQMTATVTFKLSGNLTQT